MSDAGTPLALSSFVAAAIGWLTLEFVGRPYRRFYDLRGEIIQQVIQTAKVPARYKEVRGAAPGAYEVQELSDEELKELEATQATLRELGARMGAFAHNETVALMLAKFLGYDPAAASAALIGFSNTRDRYGMDQRPHREKLVKALKLKGVAL